MRAILIGPAFELKPAQRAMWLRYVTRRLRISSRDLRIGVDGGVMACEDAKLAPQVAVGDWDSITKPALGRLKKSGAAILTLPREKDRSDLAYALQIARSFGANEILLLGFTGGRPDHHLSNLLELAQCAKSFQKITAIGPEAEYHFVTPDSGRFVIERPKETLVSVFSLSGIAKGVVMKGFEYNLRNKPLTPSSQGLSNRVLSPNAEIRLKQGTLLVVIPT